MTAPDEPLLAVSGLTKRFGGLLAVDRVAFAVRAGEILGLIGPNGSGKSTVVKLVMGIERPDAGSVRVMGAEVAGQPPHRVARRGVGLLFQHSRPLHRQTVRENIELALLPDSLLRLFADPEVERRARAVGERVGLATVLDRRPATLPFADLRRLDLAKAIAREPPIVLLDEPFAGLTAAEAGALAGLIRAFRDEGRAVLLIDHDVKRVAALADRVLAMHVGRAVAEGAPGAVTADPIVRRVYLGDGVVSSTRQLSPADDGMTVLRVADVSVHYDKAQALDRVSIHVRERECVAVVGLNGAGKTTLFEAISGLVPASGEICWKGAPLAGRSAAAIARGGIAHCPETRELFGAMTVREHLDLGGHRLSRAELAERRGSAFELFPVLAERQSQAAATLSGGEQQMLAIARALMMGPELLILDEPTLGLAPVVLGHLSRALERLRRTTPTAVLLGEGNVTFALAHADRVYVLKQGHVVWEGPPGRFAAEAGAGYI